MHEQQSATLPPNSKRLIFIVSAVVGGIVGMYASSAAVRALLGTGRSNASIDRVLVQTANEFNKNLPMLVDRHTRLDATVPLPGKKFMYKYTLIGMDLGKDAIVAELQPKAANNYKTSAGMAELRRMDVTLVYSYADEAGNEVASFEIQAPSSDSE